ncbi:MAG TPA: iron-containing alcohol dehydrogenase, partial [Pseudolysinimonas sp.]|nr:iron-containing alcohol dehydrogenase [Pseudolysinimonas sp.]
DAISLDAIRHIGASIERAVAHGDDMDARSGMAIGSLQAGIAFGVSGTHLAHALQYPIGAATHTPHGLGTGLMLPYVLELCAQTVPGRVADIGRALGLPDGPDLVLATVDRVARICANIGLPASLAELGVERDALPRIAELALASKRLINVAPLEVDHALLLRVLEAAHAGDHTSLR